MSLRRRTRKKEHEIYEEEAQKMMPHLQVKNIGPGIGEFGR